VKKAPFCPISASYSKYYPQNILYILAVKFFVFLELEQKLTFFTGLPSSRFYRTPGEKAKGTPIDTNPYGSCPNVPGTGGKTGIAQAISQYG